MSQQGSRASDSIISGDEGENSLGDLEVVRLSAVRARAIDEASATIARQLNGPLTALLLYMEELKHHSHHFSPDAGERGHLQRVVQNALAQTERVCAMVKEIAGNNPGVAAVLAAKGGWQGCTERAAENGRTAPAVLLSDAGQKPLTRREREVLNLISEGYSNKLSSGLNRFLS